MKHWSAVMKAGIGTAGRAPVISFGEVFGPKFGYVGNYSRLEYSLRLTRNV